jgi:hypothetical protein
MPTMPGEEQAQTKGAVLSVFDRGRVEPGLGAYISFNVSVSGSTPSVFLFTVHSI